MSNVNKVTADRNQRALIELVQKPGNGERHRGACSFIVLSKPIAAQMSAQIVKRVFHDGLLTT